MDRPNNQMGKHITVEPHPISTIDQQTSSQSVIPQITVNQQSSSHSVLPQINANHPNSSHNVSPQITVNQPGSSHGTSPQTAESTGCAEQDDWREEMFEQMMILKDDCLSDLVKLNEMSVVPIIRKEQYGLLPKEQAYQYRFRLYMKKKIISMIKFLQFEKNTIPEQLKGQLPYYENSILKIIGCYRERKDQWAEMGGGHQPQISDNSLETVNLTDNPRSSSGTTSDQQIPPVQPVAFRLDQDIATGTPEVSRRNHSNILPGNTSSTVPARSLGSVLSAPSNMDFLKDYYTPSSLTKESLLSISSHSTSTESIDASPSLPSPISKPEFNVSSPPAFVKSTLPPPVPMLASQARPPPTSPSPFANEIATPSASVSPLQLPTQNIGFAQDDSSFLPLTTVLPVASPRGSMKSTSPDNYGPFSALFQQNNAAATVNGPSSYLMTPSSFLQIETEDFQAADEQHVEGAMPVARKNPIDQFIAAVGSSSPAALKSSAESIHSVIDKDDRAPHGVFNSFQQWSFLEQGGSEPPNKTKRSFEIPALDYFSESSPLFNTWEDEANVQHDAKRQNTQNDRDDALYEIESANSMLRDTIISIVVDDNKKDAVTANSGGTLIKLSYTAASTLDLKALFARSKTPVIMPVKLLVPDDYPRSSPILVPDDQRGDHLRNMFRDISDAADVAFRNTLDGMPEPRSIREMASAWDACVRQAVVDFTQQSGGGTFSHVYGQWESSTSA